MNNGNGNGSKKPVRAFEDKPATRDRTPLLIGITGPSSSGKTYSALRLGVGIQRVVGGDLFVIDTEHKRATQYADKFTFRHIDFQPPFSPLDYLAAIEHCIAKGARVIVIDSMTHEHNGDGGVMDQSEQFLEDRCGDDWKKRKSMFMLSLVEPKKQRKKLNRKIVQFGVNLVCCYRAYEKVKPVRGEEPIEMGWQPETTSPLHYEMTQRFLLGPGSGGVPTLSPPHDAERLLIKNPEQFKGWFKQGDPLSEDMGEAMARWAIGDASASDLRAPQQQQPAPGPAFHWKGTEWHGRPLASADLDVLEAYRATVAAGLERAKDSAKPKVQRMLDDCDAAIEQAAAEEALNAAQNGDGDDGEVEPQQQGLSV